MLNIDKITQFVVLRNEKMGLFRKKSVSYSYKDAKGFIKKSRDWEAHEDEIFYGPMYDFR